MYTRYELTYFDDLSIEAQRKVAEQIDYNTAMEWGLLGKIRAKFPQIGEAICSKEFGVAVSAQATLHQVKELHKSWDYLLENNLIASLREKNFTLYAVIFEETFGKMPEQATGAYNASLATQYKAARKGKAITASAGAVETDKAISPSKLPEEIYMTWDELVETGRHRILRKNDITLYRVIYCETFTDTDYIERISVEGDDHHLAGFYTKVRQRWWLERLSKMTWDELVEEELTNKLKALDWNVYCEVFEKKYGRKPYGG